MNCTYTATMSSHKKKIAANFNNLAVNKTAGLNYEILDTFDAGLVLQGCEVKSCKLGQINLKGSYAKFDKSGALWLHEAYIAAYKPAALPRYNPMRERKLLLNKKELRALYGGVSAPGASIVPIKIYIKNRLIKAVIALVRGKKKYDKRATIKKREIDKQIRQKVRV